MPAHTQPAGERELRHAFPSSGGWDADRFWAKVQPGGVDECWPWLGTRLPKGYGQHRSGKSGTLRARRVLAHRLAWQLAHGRLVPEGLCVLHRCDNPPCCNPAHLFIGTLADNNADMRAKRRARFGERHPAAKLTAGDVAEIRRAHGTGECSQRALGRRFGISPQVIWDIVHGHTWRVAG